MIEELKSYMDRRVAELRGTIAREQHRSYPLVATFSEGAEGAYQEMLVFIRSLEKMASKREDGDDE